jgi:hypothetical protein
MNITLTILAVAGLINCNCNPFETTEGNGSLRSTMFEFQPVAVGRLEQGAQYRPASSLEFVAVGFLEDGRFWMRATGGWITKFAIERSYDNINWEVMAVVERRSDPIIIDDDSPFHPKALYRGKVLEMEEP